MGRRWFLDLPEYIEQGGDAEDLERIGFFRDLLETLAEGESTLVFQMDVRPFAGAAVFELVGTSGGSTRGYYHLSSYRGARVDWELWLNTPLFIAKGGLPERIYFKRVAFPLKAADEADFFLF